MVAAARTSKYELNRGRSLPKGHADNEAISAAVAVAGVDADAALSSRYSSRLTGCCNFKLLLGESESERARAYAGEKSFASESCMCVCVVNNVELYTEHN